MWCGLKSRDVCLRPAGAACALAAMPKPQPTTVTNTSGSNQRGLRFFIVLFLVCFSITS